MIVTVLATVLAVSSASMAQHSPDHGTAAQESAAQESAAQESAAQESVAQESAARESAALSGQCTSASGTCSLSPIRPPIRALILRSLRQNAPAERNWGVAASASRTAVTARRWATLDKPGGPAR